MKIFIQGLMYAGTLFLVFAPFFIVAAGLLAVMDIESQGRAARAAIYTMLAWPVVFVTLLWLVGIEERLP